MFASLRSSNLPEAMPLVEAECEQVLLVDVQRDLGHSGGRGYEQCRTDALAVRSGVDEESFYPSAVHTDPPDWVPVVPLSNSDVQPGECHLPNVSLDLLDVASGQEAVRRVHRTSPDTHESGQSPTAAARRTKESSLTEAACQGCRIDCDFRVSWLEGV